MPNTFFCFCMLVMALTTKDHTLYIAAGLFALAASIQGKGKDVQEV